MYNIIAIEREYASAGNEIGKLTAKNLGYQFYDRTILVEAAKRLNIPPSYVEDLEETAPGSIIFNLSQTSLGGNDKNRQIPLADRLFYEEKAIIQDIVQKENCVIVGRCASYLLKERTDCLKVFIYADKTFRLQRAVEKEKIPAKDAESILKKVDKRRSSYYNIHTGQTWDNRLNFDLSINSGNLGIANCVEFLSNICR